MQDASFAVPPGRSPDAPAEIAARRHRRRVLAGCAALALGLHLALFGGASRLRYGSPAEVARAPMATRTVDGGTGPTAMAVPATAVAATIDEPVAARTLTPAGAAVPVPAPARGKARSTVTSPGAETIEPAPKAMPAVLEAEVGARLKSVEATPGAGREGGTAASADTPGMAATTAAAPSLLAPGEEPPPVYPTRLPAAATLHYQVRRGALAGTGDIRWSPGAEGYRLVLESRLAGLVLLRQTSEGTFDAAGLAPSRFVDQRIRRGAQAANFRRDAGTITFSGPAVEWPLLPGSQDRLSWMIQLAGIAAAAPERLVEGARIALIVVGARGEASLWTLRCAGRETVETVRGHVEAIRLVRDARSAYDTGAEIWLDPERDFLPVRATLRNGSGDAEVDLVLERIERP